MSYDTLVFLCKNEEEAAAAAKALPRNPQMRRFFVFLGEDLDEKSLQWMKLPHDTHIHLERAVEWCDNWEDLGVRAGLWYTFGWGFLFCHASLLPDEEEVTRARQMIAEKGLYRGNRIWGVTREHLVMQGGIADLRKPSEPPQIKDPAVLAEAVQNVTDADLSKAMAGEEVEEAVVLRALQEVIPLKAMSLHSSAQLDETHRSFLAALFTLALNVDEEFPRCLIAGSTITPEETERLRAHVPKHGALVKVEPRDFAAITAPYQIFYMPAWRVACYQGSGNL